MKGTVHQLNVKPQTPGEVGLPKRPADKLKLTKTGFEGDYNRYRQEKKGGTPDRAVLLMPLETLRELEKEGWPVKAGDVGENVTSLGLAYADFAVGRSFALGQARIQISEPCNPCKNLGALPYIGAEKAPQFIKTLMGRRGWYARVLEEGVVSQGDLIELLA